MVGTVVIIFRGAECFAHRGILRMAFTANSFNLSEMKRMQFLNFSQEDRLGANSEQRVIWLSELGT